MNKESELAIKVKDLLTRGVDEVIDRETLEKKLLSGKKLRIKFGIDPTSPNIHLGRSIPLLKLRDFQDLGHQIVFIIGDSTGIIGDTSDKDSERPMLTKGIVEKNLKNYKEQAGKIIDLSKAETHYNSEWLDKLNYGEIGRQAGVFSVNEFISRENISKRLEAGKRVSLRELLYPLMQGYDSVVVKSDVEIGGSDQRFNMLAGRDMQREYGQEPQGVLTFPLIEGLDGRKMSSSWGNTGNLCDIPNDMFGKIMSLKDEYIIKYFVQTTRVPMETVNKYAEELKSGTNPRDIKMKLAFEIVKFFHSEAEAEEAQTFWSNTFSKKELPTDIKTFTPTKYDLLSVIIEAGLVSSKSEAYRVFDQNGVKVNGETVTDVKHVVKAGDIIQKGKMSFIKIA
ncbi:MAG: tyrosine--tRNA ligase [bacterium]